METLAFDFSKKFPKKKIFFVEATYLVDPILLCRGLLLEGMLESDSFGLVLL